MIRGYAQPDQPSSYGVDVVPKVCLPIWELTITTEPVEINAI